MSNRELLIRAGSGLLFVFPALLLFSGSSLFATGWTTPHLHQADPLLERSWRIHVLSRYSDHVPGDAEAVRLEGREGLALLDKVPPTVEYLELAAGYETVTAEQMAHLKNLPNVISLNLSVSPKMRDKAFAVLSELSSLRSLRIPDLTIARAGTIARCSQLECLQFYGDVDAKALERLSGLASLRRLSASPSVWTKELVGALAKFRSLRTLSLQGPLIPRGLKSGEFRPDKADWAILNKLPKLESLKTSFVHPKLDDSVIAAICRDRAMIHVETEVPLSLDTVKMLASSKSLRTFHASVTHAESFDAHGILSRCENLEDLSLYLGSSGATGLDSLKATRNLELVFVHGGAADSLKTLPAGIRSLRVGGPVPAATLPGLALAIAKTQCESLELNADLGTDGRKVFREFLARLARHSALRSLDLGLSGDCSAIGEEEWKLLHESRALTHLTLRLDDDEPRDASGARQTDDGVPRHVFDADELNTIAGIPSLISLDISEQRIQPDAMGVLRDSKLVSLCLEGVRSLTGADVKALASSNIRDLNLQSTGIPLSVETVRSLLKPESRRLVLLGIGASTRDSDVVLEAIKQTPHAAEVRVVSTVLDD